MKIKTDQGETKPFLHNGRHEVEITQIDEGTSEYKGVAFFACRFENDEGFVEQRFYNSDQGRPILLQLFEAAGVEMKKELDTDALLHKKVSIRVDERTYDDPQTGNEKTLKQASEFRKVNQ